MSYHKVIFIELIWSTWCSTDFVRHARYGSNFEKHMSCNACFRYTNISFCLFNHTHWSLSIEHWGLSVDENAFYFSLLFWIELSADFKSVSNSSHISVESHVSISVHAQYGRDGFCVAFIVLLLKFQRFQVLIRFSI